MRQGRFPPFGFEFSEFGLRDLRLALFLMFFDVRSCVLCVLCPSNTGSSTPRAQGKVLGAMSKRDRFLSSFVTQNHKTVPSPGSMFEPIFDPNHRTIPISGSMFEPVFDPNHGTIPIFEPGEPEIVAEFNVGRDIRATKSGAPCTSQPPVFQC